MISTQHDHRSQLELGPLLQPFRKVYRWTTVDTGDSLQEHPVFSALVSRAEKKPVRRNVACVADGNFPVINWRYVSFCDAG